LIFPSELPEKISKQVSAPQQSKKLCLTSSFESNNFIPTSKNGKMLISGQRKSSKMLISLEKQ